MKDISSFFRKKGNTGVTQQVTLANRQKGEKQRKTEKRKKGTSKRERERNIQRHQLTDHLSRILYPSGTRLDQILLILSQALA